MSSDFSGLRTTRRKLIAGAGAAIAATPALHARAAAIPMPAVRIARNAVEIPDGMALVTSPRIPLFDVGPDDAGNLLAGAFPNWTDVGSPVSRSIEPVAVGAAPGGMTAAETYADYEALVKGFEKRPGAVALVPVDQVDYRVNVLSVGGHDPLREPSSGETPVRVAFVGDIVPGRNVDNKMQYYGDYTHPFLKIQKVLSRFDATIANLEGNLSNDLPHPTDAHTYTFVSSPQMVDGLTMSGIDAVSLANNHSTWNSEGWGTQGLTDTIAALKNGGMPYFGAGADLDEARKPFEITAQGKKIAIYGVDGVTANTTSDEGLAGIVYGSNKGNDGYVGAGDGQPGTNPYLTDQFTSDIADLVKNYDMVIPYFHFGVEYVDVPPTWAADGARAAIDAGATMVVSNHPHVIQGMEVYKGVPIVYSVGNFIFDQMFSVQVREGSILEIVIRGGKVVGLRPRGVEIEDFNQPRLMSLGEHASQMDRFWDAADRIAARG